MKLFAALIAAFAGAASLAVAAAGPEFDWGLPAGVAPPPVPADNPMSQAKAALGQRLFYEPALSRNFTLSCGTCHQQHRAFAELLPTHRGVDGQAGKRNAPGLANIAYLSPLTWADSGALTLEVQAQTPIFGEHPVEMGMTGMDRELTSRLAADACYRRQFAEAFPGEAQPVSKENVAKALAAFQRTLLSFDSPYDRARRGEQVTLSEGARRGAALFERKGCQSCHSGANFTDLAFYDIGLPAEGRDRGLIEKTGREGDAGKFRTPGLRNVSVTGPYFHDGSMASLTGAILAHARGKDGGQAAPVSEEEAVDLSLFLETLTDPTFLRGSKFAKPADRCQAAT